MRTQSAGYNPFRGVREVDFHVRFDLIDPDAKEDATASASSTAPVSDAENVLNGNEEAAGKWLTLEKNLWALDGTMSIMPRDGSADNGWWSAELSSDNAEFSGSLPTITFSFTKPVSTIGFMLYFDDKVGQYPEEILVQTYGDAGSLIAETTMHPSGSKTVVDLLSQNYYSAKITFKKTFLPNRRVKLQEIIFGVIQEFDADSMSSASITYGADIAAAKLPSRELKFTIDNSDRKYNLLNPTGIYEYLQDGQKIAATAVIDGEKVDCGTFYFTRAEAKDEAVTAQITANDLLYALDSDIFTGGSAETKPLSEAIAAVLDGYDIPTNFGGYNGQVGQLTVAMAVPEGKSKREAIRLLAQAAMCTAWIDRDGVMQFTPLSVADEAAGALTPDELYDYGGVSVSDKVAGIALKVKNEYADTEATYYAGLGAPVKTVSNPCVVSVSGQNVANWLLACYKRRKNYKVKNRCDPATEIADTLQIADAFGQNANAVVTNILIKYNGGLSATTTAVGP